VHAGIEVHQTLAAKSGLCVLGFGARASVGRAAAHWSRFPPFDPVREAVARTDKSTLHTGVLVATLRFDAPARCGAFVGARRIVAGDTGGRGRVFRFGTY